MAKRQSNTLRVTMNGLFIGVLAKTSSGGMKFTYDDEWLSSPLSRPISLSLPLINTTFEGDIVTNFFDNLLPDNPKIRARIQSKFQIATQNPFDLLSVIGRDCVGAIQLVAENDEHFNKKIECVPLSDAEIAAILVGYQQYPLGMKDSDDDFRISIAGAQEKSAFLYHNGQWNKPIGTTPTTHIFKLPIGYISPHQIDLSDSCENEWLCAKITEAFGLPVAKCKVAFFQEVKALVVERFDRSMSADGRWIMRLPQEDICQALGVSSHLKYQADGGPGIKTVMDLLLGSANATVDRDMFFRSQVLFWILAAIDGHAKNFSLFILPQGKYRLAPLYDILSAYPLMNVLQMQKVKMAMSLRGKHNHYHWHHCQRRFFLQTAKFANYSVERATEILEEMLSKVDNVIETVSVSLPESFPQYIAQPIFDGMRAMKCTLSQENLSDG